LCPGCAGPLRAPSCRKRRYRTLPWCATVWTVSRAAVARRSTAAVGARCGTRALATARAGGTFQHPVSRTRRQIHTTANDGHGIPIRSLVRRALDRLDSDRISPHTNPTVSPRLPVRSARDHKTLRRIRRPCCKLASARSAWALGKPTAKSTCSRQHACSHGDGTLPRRRKHSAILGLPYRIRRPIGMICNDLQDRNTPHRKGAL
jgi:hypothetical protein